MRKRACVLRLRRFVGKAAGASHDDDDATVTCLRRAPRLAPAHESDRVSVCSVHRSTQILLQNSPGVTFKINYSIRNPPEQHTEKYSQLTTPVALLSSPAVLAASHTSPPHLPTNSRHRSAHGFSVLSNLASARIHCCVSANAGRYLRLLVRSSSSCIVPSFRRDGVIVCDRPDRVECTDDGCEAMRGLRGVEGADPGVVFRPACRSSSRVLRADEGAVSCSSVVEACARREDLRGVLVVVDASSLSGDENFCRFDGVASASNSSSSASAIGPSNTTLRLCDGVLRGDRSALGARKADFEGLRVTAASLSGLREGVGGGSAGGRTASFGAFVGDAAAFEGEAVDLEGDLEALSEATSASIFFAVSWQNSCSASVISLNWSPRTP